MFIERAGVVRVEIVLHQADGDRVGILRGERLAEQRIFALGPLGVDLPEAASRQWFDGRQQDTGTELFIAVMLFAGLPWLHRYGEQRVADQETGSLIKTDHWIVRVIGQGIERQNAFHVREKGGIQGAQAPSPAEMGL